MIIAIFGNSLSPYMLFWQTSEEAEESIVNNKRKEMGFRKPMISNKGNQISKSRCGTWYGICSICYVVNYMVTTGGSLSCS